MSIGGEDFSDTALLEGHNVNLCVVIDTLNDIAEHFGLDRSYRLLGRGGQGCVLLMTGKDDKKEYAVKIMDASKDTWRQYEWSEFEVPRALGKSLKTTGHDHLVLSYYQKHYFEKEGKGVILMELSRGDLLSNFLSKGLAKHVANLDEFYRDMMKQLLLVVEHLGEIGIAVSKQPVKDNQSSAMTETECRDELSVSIVKSFLDESSTRGSSLETSIRRLSFHDLKPENIMVHFETGFYEYGFKSDDDNQVLPLRYVTGSCKVTVFDFGAVRDCSAMTLAHREFNPASPMYSDPAVSLTCLANERRVDANSLDGKGVGYFGPPSWAGDVSQCWSYDLWSVAAVMKLAIRGEGPNEEIVSERHLVPEDSDLRVDVREDILDFHQGFFYAESFDQTEYERTVDLVPRIGCEYIARSPPIAACTAAMQAIVPLDVNRRSPPSAVLEILKPVAVGGHLRRDKSPVLALQRQCRNSNDGLEKETVGVEPPVESDRDVEP